MVQVQWKFFKKILIGLKRNLDVIKTFYIIPKSDIPKDLKEYQSLIRVQ